MHNIKSPTNVASFSATLPSTSVFTFFIALMAALALAMAGTANAQNNFELSQLGPGELLLNLSITEQTEVDQDQLNAVLEYSTRGRDRTALQSEVNAAIAEALDSLEGREGFDYSTQRYSVYALSDNRGPGADEPLWQASQSIELSGLDSDALLAAAGELQAAGLTMNSLYYSLSSEEQQRVSDKLLSVALGSLQSRADEAAELLNKRAANLVEVSLSHNQRNSFARATTMQAMSVADSEAFSPPSAEPGTSTVSLSVSARALLTP